MGRAPRPTPRHPCSRRQLLTGRRQDDRGQITVIVVTLIVSLMAFGGLILDGGLALAAKITALGQAQEAARAGAQAVDLAAYRAHGTVRLDADHARRLAADYLQAAGATGTVTATAESVTVTVTDAQPTRLLTLVGVNEVSVTASGSAEPEPGLPPPS
ncbi:TadE/TadG family type IV pilus assembly protein [Streptomyces phytophilus]|uniref:TadE/TadG family type IV pilus assembly protein n=1 Tax=Streptomyces phytophilus TaxID=722715 RepID=UPI001C68FFD8|nr:hypothetical protein [Streptomyces phytophilus]